MIRLRPHLHRGSSRPGQALVEFAVILPILALMLVMALDFGRIFFGWVALHNAVRIGADYAAANAYAWDGSPPPYQSDRDRYEELIVNDLQSLNCDLPAGDPVDEPTFSGFADGDLVQAEVTCSFELLTPLAENVFGGPIEMTVRADFAINAPIIGGIPGGPPPVPPAPGCDPGELLVPDLIGDKLQDGFATWDATEFTGAFSPAVTNPNKNRIIQTQNPVAESCAPSTSGMTVTHS